MQVHAITKNIRMSAQKMREVVRQIQGLPALQAQAILAVVPRKGARFVAKTLKSAIANAENNNKANIESLRIKEAVAQTATTLKRFTPKARGSAGPILKRNCHVKIVLTDEEVIVWVKNLIQSASASPSIKTGARSGMPAKKNSANCLRKIAKS